MQMTNKQAGYAGRLKVGGEKKRRLREGRRVIIGGRLSLTSAMEFGSTGSRIRSPSAESDTDRLKLGFRHAAENWGNMYQSWPWGRRWQNGRDVH